MTSIKQHGLKQPIGVGKTKRKNEYVLIWGYRRLNACKKLGWTTIPCVVEDEPKFQELLIINAVENLQRTDITPEELGRICLKLEQLGLSIGEIASRLGVYRQKVVESMKIYKYIPEKIRKRVAFMIPGKTKAGKISATAMGKILNAKKEYGFSNKVLERIVDATVKNELTTTDISIIAVLMRRGYSVAEALKRRAKYSIQQVQVLVDTDVVTKLAKKNKTNIPGLIRKIVHGEVSPVKEAVID
jgi:ParB/RepB/Spo0J family partition protein